MQGSKKLQFRGSKTRGRAWAEDEAGLLKSEIDAFYGQRPYSVKAEPYGDNTGGEISLDLRTRPDLIGWTRRVGGTIDYLRAALNYAAYQIALTDCPGKVGNVEFPIFNDPATFQAKNRAKDFDAVRLSLIESAQPYPGRAQELWWLHELARFHRHRLIHPVIDVAGEFMDSYTLISGSLDDITSERVPFTQAPSGAFLIGRWNNASPAVTQVEVKPNLAVHIVVNDPLVKHEPLPALLFRMSNATREILTALEKTLP